MKTKIISLLLMPFFLTAIAFAQPVENDSEGYIFTPVREISATSVKNQFRSGTCWSFSGLSFLESELIRLGKGEFDLSEMFVVRHTYQDKAINYVRFHGNLNFGGGGAFHDVFNVIKRYGIVSEEAYSGLNYGEDKHVHFEMDEVLKGYVEAVVENKNRKLTPAWIEGYKGILDAYLGRLPERFNYNGSSYTPETFASSLGLKLDDYLYITSFTHHPLYTQFVMELPDNWAMERVWNVSLEDLWQIVVNAVNNGYTVGWATDVSEKGFSWNKGLAIVPDIAIEHLDDTERARWEALTQREKDEQLYKFDKPGKELIITPEIRQTAFDNYETTDDHGMHIVGIVKDQNGTEYLKVKNSWSDSNHIYNGYLYASKSFFLYKTTNIVIHKNGVPSSILRKLNL
ncbi:MAG: C1 family peptidase [Bacteroidales bacterium]|nr:C1 family peptidase [Bacteroidales bacterium]